MATTKEQDQIVKLKDQGKTWAEISETTGIAQGKAMFLYEQASVTPKTRITGKTEEQLNENIAQARVDGLSWGVISARSGKSEGYCRKAYEEVTGNSASGDRIGKGGRFPGGEPAMKPGKTTAKATKQAAKKTVKKAAKAVPAKKAAVAKKQAAKKKATAKKQQAAAA